VELSYVGENRLNILRCIHLSMEENETKQLIQKSFNPPNYIRLPANQSFLQNIEIILKTDKNCYFHLSDDKNAYIYLTLHFRKRF